MLVSGVRHLSFPHQVFHCTRAVMQLDDLLLRYFASTNLAEIAPDTLAAGIEHCRVDLGLQQDRGKRFALWSFLHMFGSAPDLDVAFENKEDREAARNFMDLLAASESDGES